MARDASHLGIDLGTIYSSVAYVDDRGEPVAIPNSQGKVLTPSVVHVRKDGALDVGEAALNYTEDVLRGFKRHMDDENASLLAAGKYFTPVQLSAAILRQLASDAQAYLGHQVVDVNISVPAHYDHIGRQAVKKAARLAGLQPRITRNEPTCAATAYLHQHHGSTPVGWMVVFDLGGYTLDISLLEMTPVGPFVRDHTGAGDLGGYNFDNILADLVKERYHAQSSQEIAGDVRLRLYREIEQVKITLSDQEVASLQVGPPEAARSITVTRDEFTAATAHLVTIMRRFTETLLGRNKIAPSAIAQVIAVGGASRTPSVQRMLHDYFGHDPDTSLNPELAVVWGAALDYQGDLIHDVLTQAIHIAVRNEQGYVPETILERGWSYGKWSSKRLFRPVIDFERKIVIRVFQGNGSEIEQLKPLKPIEIDLPPRSSAATTKVEVEMRPDLSGILEVRVTINDGSPQTFALPMEG